MSMALSFLEHKKIGLDLRLGLESQSLGLGIGLEKNFGLRVKVLHLLCQLLINEQMRCVQYFDVDCDLLRLWALFLNIALEAKPEVIHTVL